MNQSNLSSIVNPPGGNEHHHLCGGCGGGVVHGERGARDKPCCVLGSSCGHFHYWWWWWWGGLTMKVVVSLWWWWSSSTVVMVTVVSVLKSSLGLFKKLVTKLDCNWFGPNHGCRSKRLCNPFSCGCSGSSKNKKLVATSCNQFKLGIYIYIYYLCTVQAN